MDALIKLSTQLGQALKEKNFTLALAESCTGGLASAAITDIAGSSAWFDCGFVTYSNAAKQSMLNVSEKTLTQYGAVSEKTAEEMAIGALNNSLADIAGSITGIAGPTGGSIDKPVGTVCFAYAIKNGCVITTSKHFTGNRQQIRQQSVIQLLNGLMDLINH
ncbi:MAG: nicotinamide-nucleotide amidohydrolase family protein [Betaproteobacteria bacterium]|nr:nicotinamide-nucleotide amidohydrolase family protein [Betaproteobacteria bacterium]MCH9848389.1 nicotinamide-nucleotide amidohydrolase family protein [Betaproteobacteria bacterium]